MPCSSLRRQLGHPGVARRIRCRFATAHPEICELPHQSAEDQQTKRQVYPKNPEVPCAELERFGQTESKAGHEECARDSSLARQRPGDDHLHHGYRYEQPSNLTVDPAPGRAGKKGSG